jgi:imidazole glycerol phosphate synthase subunit HisF
LNNQAGGHRATWQRPVSESLVGVMSLVPAITQAVSIPVVAAGGMMSGSAIAASLMLGASVSKSWFISAVVDIFLDSHLEIANSYACALTI